MFPYGSITEISTGQMNENNNLANHDQLDKDPIVDMLVTTRFINKLLIVINF